MVEPDLALEKPQGKRQHLELAAQRHGVGGREPDRERNRGFELLGEKPRRMRFVRRVDPHVIGERGGSRGNGSGVRTFFGDQATMARSLWEAD